MSVEVAKHARELLLKEYRGALATLSKAMPGFPFGSMVPYCLDEQGRPLILISRIAQHTHNLRKDPKCSLMVGERGAEDVQAVGRLTYLAEAEQLTDPAAIARPFSLVFVAVKATQNPAISAWLTALCDEKTVVCVLQNGVEQQAQFADRVAGATVLPAVVWFPAQRQPDASAHQAGQHAQPLQPQGGREPARGATATAQAHQQHTQRRRQAERRPEQVGQPLPAKLLIGHL